MRPVVRVTAAFAAACLLGVLVMPAVAALQAAADAPGELAAPATLAAFPCQAHACGCDSLDACRAHCCCFRDPAAWQLAMPATPPKTVKHPQPPKRGESRLAALACRGELPGTVMPRLADTPWLDAAPPIARIKTPTARAAASVPTAIDQPAGAPPAPPPRFPVLAS